MQIKAHDSSFIGKNTLIFESLPSTNDYLRQELAKSTPFPEGTVIMAVHQFSGKGQRGAVWLSQKGMNLTFSILLRPDFLEPQKQFLLTIAVSVAIVEALQNILESAHHVQVKWPNDIYVDGEKIAGILMENSIRGKNWNHAIVGIGLNVNQEQFHEVGLKHTGRIGSPTSLKLLTAEEQSLDSILRRICAYIEHYYLGLKSGEENLIITEYLDKMFRFGESAPYLAKGRSVIGKICGITPEGRLLLEIDGEVLAFDLKEIRFQ